MALNNYANLKAAIQGNDSFSHREDALSRLDDFIDLCESRINSTLQIRTNELRATAELSTRFLQLPDGFLQMRRLSFVGNKTYEVHYKTPESMEIKNQGGRPRYFTVTSQIEFDRVPDTAYQVEMSYYRTITPLSDSNTTNDVLTKYPELYLYGSLAEFHRWAKDTTEADYCDSVFQRKILEAQKQEKRGRFGPAPRMIYEGPTP